MEIVTEADIQGRANLLKRTLHKSALMEVALRNLDRLVVENGHMVFYSVRS